MKFELKLDKLPKKAGGVRYANDTLNIYVPQDVLKKIGGGNFPPSITMELKGEQS